MNTHRKQRRGTATVEFALAAPVLFLMLFGIVEFGRVMLVRNAMANAVREGGRVAALATTIDRDAVDAMVQQQIAGVASPDDFQIEVEPAAFNDIESGTPLTVSLSVRYADISWVPVSHLVGDAELQASSAQIRE